MILLQKKQSFADIEISGTGVDAQKFVEASDGVVKMFGEEDVRPPAEEWICADDSYQSCSAMGCLPLFKPTSEATLL